MIKFIHTICFYFFSAANFLSIISVLFGLHIYTQTHTHADPINTKTRTHNCTLTQQTKMKQSTKFASLLFCPKFELVSSRLHSLTFARKRLFISIHHHHHCVVFSRYSFFCSLALFISFNHSLTLLCVTHWYTRSRLHTYRRAGAGALSRTHCMCSLSYLLSIVQSYAVTHYFFTPLQKLERIECCCCGLFYFFSLVFGVAAFVIRIFLLTVSLFLP